jgi:molybdopterin molybdotransferase
MLTLDEALRRLLDRAGPSGTETLALAEAVGRVLVEPTVVAAIDVPPFSNSAMDGFAIRAADAPGSLPVVGEAAAGAGEPDALEAGTAVRIMTGAPIPSGADTVVPLEDAIESDGRVAIPSAVLVGAHVRAAAHDTRAGDEVLLDGPLTAARLAVLASIGVETVDVRCRPTVAVISTGDELVAPGVPLGPGQIHDSNGVALAAAVVEAGGVPVVLPRQRDDPDAIQRTLTDAARRTDLVVTSGGVSVGRRDHIRDVLDRAGNLDFWRIAVQPGKPLAVGSIGETTVIGLPGNPVSALVTFELLVRPFLRAMQGLPGDGRSRVRATPTERMPKSAGRRAFLRVRIARTDGELRARPAGGQASSQLRPMAEANALLVVPEDAEAAETDAAYEAIMLEPPELGG